MENSKTAKILMKKKVRDFRARFGIMERVTIDIPNS